MLRSPRKPKQLYREDILNKSDQYINYDLFHNEECNSFLSSSFCSNLNKSIDNYDQNVKPNHSASILDITTDDVLVESSRTNVKFLPLIYLLASGITIFGGILNSFAQKKQKIDTLFPQFLELPFRQSLLFQFGIAFTSFTGIINYCTTYYMWKQSNYQYNTTQFINCFIGVISQLCIFIFSILPVAMPNSLNLRSDDCLFINLYFSLSFVYQCVYIYTMIRTVPKIIKITYSYQIRIAFFILSVLVFAFYISSGVLQLQVSNVKFEEQAIQNANSVCAYILFGLNTLFISLFYFDLKTVNLILKFAHIQDVKKTRKYNQNIL